MLPSVGVDKEVVNRLKNALIVDQNVVVLGAKAANDFIDTDFLQCYSCNIEFVKPRARRLQADSRNEFVVFAMLPPEQCTNEQSGKLDYPAPHELAAKFHFSVDVQPLPIEEDFRVQISAADADKEVKLQYQRWLHSKN